MFGYDKHIFQYIHQWCEYANKYANLQAYAMLGHCQMKAENEIAFEYNQYFGLTFLNDP